jgi:acyl-CoA reductase-like NAD-dependent aldehyde dehydrogenase
MSSFKLRSTYSFYVGGISVDRSLKDQEPDSKTNVLNIYNKYTNEKLCTVYRATKEEINKSKELAIQCSYSLDEFTSDKRKHILLHLAKEMKVVVDYLIHLVVVECGKPIFHAKKEVLDAVDLIHLTAEEFSHIFEQYEDSMKLIEND